MLPVANILPNIVAPWLLSNHMTPTERYIQYNANVVTVQKLHIRSCFLLLFSWPRANFKTRFMKVTFVSETQKEKLIAQWLRNCQLNIESSLRGCICNWHRYFPFKRCCSATHAQCHRGKPVDPVWIQQEEKKKKSSDSWTFYQLYRWWHPTWWTSERT